MNSRAWYGVEEHFVEKSEPDRLVTKLLNMCAEAIGQYFTVGNSRDYSAIMKMDKTKLPIPKLLFLEWFSEKGLPFLKELAEINLPEKETLTSKLEYELYILEEEMDFQYPDDVRSTLISIVNDLTEYTKVREEVSRKEISVTLNSSTFNGNWNKYLHDLVDATSTSRYPHKKVYKSVSKNEEPAQVADSSFFYSIRSEIIGNVRLL